MAFPKTDALHSRVDHSFQDGTEKDPLTGSTASDKSAAVRRTPAGPSKAAGAFSGAAQSQGYNHNHASQMAHMASRRLAVARALSRAPGVAPVMQPPGAAQSVPSAASAAPNYKQTVAQVAAQRGVPATVGHVHGAIDSLTQKGALTPFQGAHLKQHNGPLHGPAGQRTVGMIANELVGARAPVGP